MKQGTSSYSREVASDLLVNGARTIMVVTLRMVDSQAEQCGFPHPMASLNMMDGKVGRGLKLTEIAIAAVEWVLPRSCRERLHCTI